MKVSDTIEATARPAGNKGVARKLRRAGRVPAVAYGPGAKENSFLSVDPKTFLAQRAQYGTSHLFEVKADGKTFKALIKQVDRDPVTSEVVHVDLYAVDMAKPIRLPVPIELVGKHKGAIDGGLLTQVLRSIEVMCLPSQIPSKLTVDVTELGIGDTLHMSDIKLPDGVKFTTQHDEAVAACLAPDTKEETPAAAEGAAPAAAAAPAAEAKKEGK